MSNPTIARLVMDQDQVSQMTDKALADYVIRHEAEILSLDQRIKAARDPDSTVRSLRALEVLRLHLSWLHREQRSRAKRAAAEEREARRLAAEALQAQAIEAKKARQLAAAGDSARGIEVFKAVAREVLGDEMYSYLWELARQRIESAKPTP